MRVGVEVGGTFTDLVAVDAVITPLDAAAAAAMLLPALQAGDHDAVAICLLSSYANPDHERALQDALSAGLPDVFVTCSCDVIREFREYERASTTTLAAYVQPVIDAYLDRLAQAVPDKVIACGFDTTTSGCLSWLGETGYSVHLEIYGGGYGASSTGNGCDVVDQPMANCANTPAEAIDQDYSFFRVEEYALAPDSFGHGAHRGGAGFVKAFRILKDGANVALCSDRFRNAPEPLFGGTAGTTGACAASGRLDPRQALDCQQLRECRRIAGPDTGDPQMAAGPGPSTAPELLLTDAPECRRAKLRMPSTAGRSGATGSRPRIHKRRSRWFKIARANGGTAPRFPNGPGPMPIAAAGAIHAPAASSRSIMPAASPARRLRRAGGCSRIRRCESSRAVAPAVCLSAFLRAPGDPA